MAALKAIGYGELPRWAIYSRFKIVHILPVEVLS